MSSKPSSPHLKEVTRPPGSGIRLVEAIRAWLGVARVPNRVVPSAGDRRRHARFECSNELIQAAIRIPDGTERACLLTDFSAYGARLVVEGNSCCIGDRITLFVPLPDGTSIECNAEVRSRFLDDFLGIKFID